VRITWVRRLWQAAFLALFLFLVWMTAAEAARLGALTCSASFFLEVDPLVALGTLCATGQLYHLGAFGLAWALVVFASALLFGRAFCAWVCPFGATHHALGWLFRPRSAGERRARNDYRPAHALKYVLLAAFLAAALTGSAWFGLLDPMSMYHRSLATSLFPLVEAGARVFMPHGAALIYPGDVALYQGGWAIGAIVLGLFLANTVFPRFFCRVLCPLGALLGIFSRFALFRVARDEAKCTSCAKCREHCEGACDPDRKLRLAECVVCLNCIDDCPHGALGFRWLPPEAGAIAVPVVRDRRLLLAACAGAVATPFVRLSGGATCNLSPLAIRPPGAVEELEFLKRCVKCGQCMRVCPSNVIQPALIEAGLEGVWTPVLNMRYGACEQNCALCGQVCPTGAIERLTVAQRNGEAPYPGRDGPVKVSVGTAFFDRGRCLPWAMDAPCVVCEEVCPVSPKAIFAQEVVVTKRDGSKLTLKQPRVDPALCTGCGACEHACPVKDLPAIRVTAAGETRSRGWGERERGLLLRSGDSR
jgi:polyferredoxin